MIDQAVLFTDRLELTLLAPLTQGRRVLDVATGSGLLLCGLQEMAHRAVGVDLSQGMLRFARRRGLAVVQGTASALPFPDGAFDVVCCFKAFPHLTEPAEALAEMQRVVRQQGRIVVELYNPWSFRGMPRRRGPRRSVSASLNEGHIHTRYDTVMQLRRILPSGLRVEAVRGIRIITPAGALLDLPIIGSALGHLEQLVSRAPIFWRAAGFVVVTLRKEHEGAPPGNE